MSPRVVQGRALESHATLGQRGLDHAYRALLDEERMEQDADVATMQQCDERLPGLQFAWPYLSGLHPQAVHPPRFLLRLVLDIEPAREVRCPHVALDVVAEAPCPRRCEGEEQEKNGFLHKISVLWMQRYGIIGVSPSANGVNYTNLTSLLFHNIRVVIPSLYTRSGAQI